MSKEPIYDIYEALISILSQTLQRDDIHIEQTLEMSSFEILNTLARVEQRFEIEIEDENIFRGLFSSVERLGHYIYEQLEAS